jgi:16S rRNA (cytosine1402-N4)-methyltransferase
MLSEVLEALKPQDGEIIVDGTFGAGGYARAILDSADCKVIAIDRDEEAFALGGALAKSYPGRLIAVLGRYAEMETIAARPAPCVAG